MTKYIARVSHETYGTHYRQNPGVLGPWWSEDIDAAYRYDDKESALKACSNVGSDYTKEALVAPEDRIYAAARSRRNGTLRYRASDSDGWYLTADPKRAHEFMVRFWASQSLNSVLNKNTWDFKVGTMDEIGKWYDQFGKTERVEFHTGGPVPLAHIHLSADGKITVNDNRSRPLPNHQYLGGEMAEPKKPEPANKYEASHDHMVEFGIDPVVAKYAVELRRIYDAREAGAHTFSGVLHAFLAAYAEEHE